MAQIKENYPAGCSEKEIKELLQGYSKDIYDARANINTVLALSPLLQMGLQELQGRQNKRITNLSLFISFLSLIISGVTLFFSICS